MAAAVVSGDQMDGHAAHSEPPTAFEAPSIERASEPVSGDAPDGVALVEEMLGQHWTGELNIVDAPGESSATAAAPSRSRRRLAIMSGGAALVVIALVVTVLHIIGTHDRLNRTRDTLAATEAQLEDTTVELQDTNDELSSTQSQLDTRTSERDRARRELSDAQAELATTTAALDDARGKVDLQASVIDDFRTCLDGVATAALYASDGYYVSAIDELNRVKPACDRANSAVV